MLQPDVRFLLTDPALGGGVPFTITRTTWKRAYGHEQVEKRETFQCAGNIQPAGSVDLQSMSDEDRRSDVIKIRSTFTFQTGEDRGDAFLGADEVTALGRVWRVTRIEHWEAWGFTTAYAVLKKEGGAADGMA